METLVPSPLQSIRVILLYIQGVINKRPD